MDAFKESQGWLCSLPFYSLLGETLAVRADFAFSGHKSGRNMIIQTHSFAGVQTAFSFGAHFQARLVAEYRFHWTLAIAIVVNSGGFSSNSSGVRPKKVTF